MLRNLLQKFTKYSSKSKEIFSQIQPGDICIDCGANVGLVTVEMLKRGAVVHAFEPNPFAFEQLQRKTKNYNDLCYLYQKGVWDKEDQLKLYLHEFSNEDEVKWSVGSSLLQDKGNVLHDKYQIIDVIRLSDFIASLDKPIKILKIDIEGAEYELVEDLIETGTYKNIDQIYVETHARKVPRLREKDQLLRDKIKQQDIQNINLNWI